MINLQSYNEVLDFLELFFQKYILDSNCLQDMQSILDDCRKEKMVAIRAIDSCFMEYRRKTQDDPLVPLPVQRHARADNGYRRADALGRGERSLRKLLLESETQISGYLQNWMCQTNQCMKSGMPIMNYDS